MTRLALQASAKAVKAALKGSPPRKRSVSVRRAAGQAPQAKPKAAVRQPMRAGVVGSRRYRLFKPTGHQAGTVRPLLVMLHGCLQDAQAIASVSQMNQLAASEGFFVVYPEQDRLSNSQGCWNWFATRTGQAQREADAIVSIIDRVCESNLVDLNQVAVAGFSAGASMAALVGTRHPERFCAIAMHSGIATGVAESQASALQAMRGRGSLPDALLAADPGKRLPALLVIHGSADAVVSRGNGLDAALQWAAREGANSSPERKVQRGNRYAVTVTDFKVAGRLVTSHCSISGLGHAWSGGAPRRTFSDPKGPDASRMIWSFCKKQFALSRRRVEA